MQRQNVGILGCGVISRTYAGDIRRFFPQLRAAACADMLLQAAEKLAEEFDIPRTYGSAEELLNEPSLPRNGYYAFVCEKCAPVFGHYGWFAAEAELRKRAKEINDRA